MTIPHSHPTGVRHADPTSKKNHCCWQNGSWTSEVQCMPQLWCTWPHSEHLFADTPTNLCLGATDASCRLPGNTPQSPVSLMSGVSNNTSAGTLRCKDALIACRLSRCPLHPMASRGARQGAPGIHPAGYSAASHMLLQTPHTHPHTHTHDTADAGWRTHTAFSWQE
eukprot:scaffold212414_cov24-Tisochrysis_lutea.AAC.1